MWTKSTGPKQDTNKDEYKSQDGYKFNSDEDRILGGCLPLVLTPKMNHKTYLLGSTAATDDV